MQSAALEAHNMITYTPIDSAVALIFKSYAQHEEVEVVQRVNSLCWL